jgi:Xaa-Pro aminopeptidase
MSSDRYATRRQKLLHRLKSDAVPAFLVSSPVNVSYLTGFTGDSSFLLIGPGVCTIISDGRYTTQLAQECPGLDLHIRPIKVTIIEAAIKAVKQAKLRTLGVEGDHLSITGFNQVKEESRGLDLVPLTGLVEELRAVKDADEVAEIRKAIRQAEKGFEVARAEMTGDLRELEVANNLEHTMRRFGAQGAAFGTIVASGPRSALPHAGATNGRVGSDGFVLVDWGAAAVSGYRSDLTRVLITGKISPKLEKVYGVVLRAQRAAIRGIRAGARCCDIDAIARRVIDDAGFGKHFTHGLGHGIGLEIHEGPRLSAASDAELKAGMVVTVEPGIYLAGWGGVRIEDDVLVTRSGCELLTSVPRELDEALIH